jgi:hypothetical protein
MFTSLIRLCPFLDELTTSTMQLYLRLGSEDGSRAAARFLEVYLQSAFCNLHTFPNLDGAMRQKRGG